MNDSGSVFVIYRHLMGSGLEYRWPLGDARERTLARSAAGYPERATLEREMR
jgi:hypothetical protein